MSEIDIKQLLDGETPFYPQTDIHGLVNNGEYAIDDVPTIDSSNLVSSGGVASELALGAVYDVTAHNGNAQFASLEALLTNSNLNTLIPTNIRRGGMSVKFVSSNKYVQARCMAQNFTTDVTQWQGVDVKPTHGSNNFVESNGIVEYVFDKTKEILSFSDYPQYKGRPYGGGNPTYDNYNDNYTHSVIKVNPSSELKVTFSNVSGHIICFCKTYNIPQAAGDAMDLSDTSLKSVVADGTYTIPSDTYYLVIRRLINGVDAIPTVLTIDGFDYCTDIASKIELLENSIRNNESDIEDNQDEISTLKNEYSVVQGSYKDNALGRQPEIIADSTRVSTLLKTPFKIQMNSGYLIRHYIPLDENMNQTAYSQTVNVSSLELKETDCIYAALTFQDANATHGSITPQTDIFKFVALGDRNIDIEEHFEDIEEQLTEYDGVSSWLNTSISVDELPEYHKTALNTFMNTLTHEIGDDDFAFSFITDLHIADAAAEKVGSVHGLLAVNEVSATKAVDITILGGDYIYNITESGIDEACAMNNSVRLTDKARNRRIILKGNHEPLNAISKTKFTKLTRDLNEDYNVIINNNDEEGNYGYIDFSRYKIRLLFIDSSQTLYTGDISNDAQLQWMANTALNMQGKEDWSVVLVGHIAFAGIFGTYNVTPEWNYGNRPNYKKLFTAFHDGTSVTLTGSGSSQEVDFTEQGAIPLVMIAGHTHTDGTDYPTSNGANFRIISTMDCSTTRNTNHYNAIGTVNECSFDVYIINATNKTVRTLRYGLGSNRTFTYD